MERALEIVEKECLSLFGLRLTRAIIEDGRERLGLLDPRPFRACGEPGMAGCGFTEFLSARDNDGHGSHTATTAGGNNGVAASIDGEPLGEVSGMAPRARLSAYKICWNGSLATTSVAGSSVTGVGPSSRSGTAGISSATAAGCGGAHPQATRHAAARQKAATLCILCTSTCQIRKAWQRSNPPCGMSTMARNCS
ncbi:MAG: S8 family serine peptidase [Woeseia sp.]